MQRYFVKNEQINHKEIKIVNTDHHHIKNVMRMKLNDRVYVCNEEQDCFISEIVEINNKEVILKIISKIEDKVELDTDITIAFGLTRREKTEDVLKKITELGVNGFLTVSMERSIIKVKENTDKLDRLRMISKEASEQSHRRRLVRINSNLSFKEFLEFSKDFDILLYAYEEAGRVNNSYFKEIIRDFRNKKILILVGPEGGISANEIKLLAESGFKAIGLGPRILRCETAPIYIMSAIGYEMELKRNES